jgi:RNA polymerase sigma-70 factor (ECF subfamily)
VDSPVTTRPSFEELVEEHRPLVQRSIRRVLGRSAEEDDLVQEVFCRLYVRLGQPGELCVSAWCWRVARNLAIDHARCRRATPCDHRRHEAAHGDGLDRYAIGAELRRQLAASLKELPERQRAALIASLDCPRDKGTGHEHVARSLGVSRKAAEHLLARARHRLREELHLRGVEVRGGVAGAFLAAALAARRWVRAHAPALAAATVVALLGAGATTLPPPSPAPPASRRPARLAPLGAPALPGPSGRAGTQGGAPASAGGALLASRHGATSPDGSWQAGSDGPATTASPPSPAATTGSPGPERSSRGRPAPPASGGPPPSRSPSHGSGGLLGIVGAAVNEAESALAGVASSLGPLPVAPALPPALGGPPAGPPPDAHPAPQARVAASVRPSVGPVASEPGPTARDGQESSSEPALPHRLRDGGRLVAHPEPGVQPVQIGLDGGLRHDEGSGHLPGGGPLGK